MIKHFEKKVWGLSAMITLLLLRALFYAASFELSSFDALIPSLASFHLVDISARVGLYHRLLWVTPISFLLWFYLFSLAYKRFRHKLLWRFMATASYLNIGLLLLELMTQSHEALLYFVLLLQLCFLAFYLLYHTQKLPQGHRLLSDFFFTVALSVALAMLWRALWIMIHDSIGLPAFALVFVISFAALLMLLSLLRKLPWTAIRQISLPLFFIPWLSVLATETYLICNQRGLSFLLPQQGYITGLLLLTTWIGWRIRQWRHGSRQRLSPWRPIYIMGIGLLAFTFYHPIIAQSAEMFEAANPANGIMRLFKFGEWPILQFLNSHALSELFYRALYVLLNGYQANMAFDIYNFLDTLLFYVVSFAFLSRFFKNKSMALVFILLIPFVPNIIHQGMYTALISVYFIVQLHKAYTLKNLIKLGLWTIFIALWRFDVGLANAYATLLLLLLMHLQQLPKLHWPVLLKAAAFFALLLLGGSAAAWLIQPNFFSSIVPQALSYLTVNQAHGLEQVAPAADRHLFNFYILFPLVGISLFLYATYRALAQANTTHHQQTQWLAVAFLALIYLFNMPRGLVRHSLYEGSDSFVSLFFFFIIILFSYLLMHNKNKARYMVLALSIFVLPNFSYQGAPHSHNLLQQFQRRFEQQQNIDMQLGKIERAVIDSTQAEALYLPFKAFMAANFSDTATFIDLSNTPMLYFYTQRRVPSYFCQYMQNTTTPYLQTANLHTLSHYQLPIVVFAHTPPNWFDNTDGVPNTIRYNKIAAYIYHNYRPIGAVNNYYIWLKKGLQLKDTSLLRPYTAAAPSYQLQQYAYALAQQMLLPQQASQYHSVPLQADGNSLHYHSLPSHYNNVLWLKLQSHSSAPTAKVSLSYGQGASAGSFSFVLQASKQQSSHYYAIPLSTQYNWIQNTNKQLYLHLPAHTQLLEAAIKIKTTDQPAKGR